MKKLMIALTAVAMAAAVQAGSVKWSTTTGLVAAGETDVMSSGTLQLIAVTAGTSVDDVFASVKDGAFTSVKSASMSSGKIAAQQFDMTNGSYDFYSICVDGDNFFISASKSGAVSDVGSASIGYTLKAQSNSGSIMDAAAGYQGAGWYSSVPEPTSGLLLLLGVAGLALRRRRA